MFVKKYKAKKFLAYFTLLSFLILFITLGQGIDDAKSDAVTVSATVGSTITCTTVGSPVALGTLTTAGISSAVSTSTVSCNSSTGCTLYVIDAGNGVNGGLATTSPAYLIPSPDSGYSATAALSAATEGYGVQAATTTAGTGNVLTLANRYKQTGDTVGGLTTTTQAMASSTGTFGSREVVTTHKAAVSGVTPQAVYADTITYSCSAN